MRHVIFLNGLWPSNSTAPSLNFNRSISCYQLKHWLAKFGFRSQVIDFCQFLSKAEIVSAVEHFVGHETIAIGVSTTFWPSDRSLPVSLIEAITELKDKYPQINIIAGGARTPPQLPIFDKTFAGESENSLLAWLREVSNKPSIFPDPRFDITQLNHRFDETDAILEDEILPIELGRGCIFKCKFCAHQNLGKSKFTYQRQHELLLDEMRYNKQQFGTTRYLFLDDTVNEDMDKVENLARIPEALGHPIEWVGYLRADLVWAKRGSAELLAQSGLKSCIFGVETFNAKAGKSIDKGWGAKHGKEYLPELYNNIWNKQINIYNSLIVGLPEETPESIAETYEWCSQHDIGWHFFNALTLYLEKNDKFAESEFTRNYHLYGYKNVSDTGYWESGTMTSTEALALSLKYNSLLYKTNRISGWQLFSGMNVGFPLDTVRHWTRPDFIDATAIRITEFKNRYLDKLRAIKQ